MKPVVRLGATLQYCHAMLVFWLAVCSEQVAIQISICCLSKRFFILEYCELTAMASNITSVSKREKVISLWSSGYRNKEICSRLHLSHQTVSNILSKFLQMGRRLRENQDGKNAQSLLQMWWNLWSIARFLNQAHELLKYSRAYLPTPYVLQLISPLTQQYPIL